MERNSEEARKKAIEDQSKYLATVTLQELREQLFVKNARPSPRARVMARDLLKKTVEELIELGVGSSESDRIGILEECILSFRRFRSEFGIVHMMELYGEFEAIVFACGLGAHEDLADQWRQTHRPHHWGHSPLQ